MVDACLYCGVRRPGPGPVPSCPCPGCLALVEDDLTAVAARVARPGRHDAETVPDIRVPPGLAATGPVPDAGTNAGSDTESG